MNVIFFLKDIYSSDVQENYFPLIMRKVTKVVIANEAWTEIAIGNAIIK